MAMVCSRSNADVGAAVSGGYMWVNVSATEVCGHGTASSACAACSDLLDTRHTVWQESTGIKLWVLSQPGCLCAHIYMCADTSDTFV
jgi:hypothetical protein